jgi:hypothetical protein
VRVSVGRLPVNVDGCGRVWYAAAEGVGDRQNERSTSLVFMSYFFSDVAVVNGCTLALPYYGRRYLHRRYRKKRNECRVQLSRVQVRAFVVVRAFATEVVEADLIQTQHSAST